MSGAAAGLKPGPNAGARESKGAAIAPSIGVFDVNETLLDIEFIAPLFHRLFGDAKVLREWFGQLVLYSNVITLSGSYTTFFALGQSVLKMLGSIHGVSIREADIDELRERMLTMPAHSDVPAGLQQLKDAGFRLVTLAARPTTQPAEARRHRRLVRTIVQCRWRAPIQTGTAGVPHGHRGACRTAGRDLPGGGACVGYDRSAKRRLLPSPRRLARNAPLPVHGLPQPQVVAPDIPGVAAQMIKLWR